MLSPRRSAQLGLGAACLLMVSSVAVLVAGAADSKKPDNTPVQQHIAPENTTIANAHTDSLTMNMTHTFVIADRR